jgi:hypothetical protein
MPLKMPTDASDIMLSPGRDVMMPGDGRTRVAHRCLDFQPARCRTRWIFALRNSRFFDAWSGLREHTSVAARTAGVAPVVRRYQ